MSELMSISEPRMQSPDRLRNRSDYSQSPSLALYTVVYGTGRPFGYLEKYLSLLLRIILTNIIVNEIKVSFLFILKSVIVGSRQGREVEFWSSTLNVQYDAMRTLALTNCADDVEISQ